MNAARPHFLGRRLTRADFSGTAGHTEPHASQPMPFAELQIHDGLQSIDTHRLRYVPPPSGNVEEQLRMARRRLAAEHVMEERTKLRRWLLWAVFFAAVLCACHFHPEPWGYGWQP